MFYKKHKIVFFTLARLLNGPRSTGLVFLKNPYMFDVWALYLKQASCLFENRIKAILFLISLEIHHNVPRDFYSVSICKIMNWVLECLNFHKINLSTVLLQDLLRGETTDDASHSLLNINTFFGFSKLFVNGGS